MLGDKYRLEHVISNLVSKVLKFSPAGSYIDVNIACQEIIDGQNYPKTPGENYYLNYIIKVIGQGVGISKDEISKFFTPFQQIRPNDLQKDQGSGLGLVLARDMIKLHGGNLECISEINSGTTFVITLPLLVINDNSASVKNSTNSIQLIEENKINPVKKIKCLVTDGKYSQFFILFIWGEKCF